MIVFSNTTLTIALSSIGRLHLLPKLFGEIHLVTEVIDECHRWWIHFSTQVT